MRKISYLQAIKEAIYQSMKRDKRVFVYGEGSDPALGSFHKSSEMAKEFGTDRYFDTPLSETGLQGIGIGAAINGARPIMVWFRFDFLLMGLDQICNHASKLHYIYGMKCPIVMKTTIGRGWGQGPVHSQSFHSILSHFPGLKVVLPSNPYDAKGLMIESIKDNNPVVYIEHKFLFNEISNVPKKNYTIPIGKGHILRKGKDVTIVAFSLMVKEALKAADVLSKENISVEIVDPRSSYPLDIDTIVQSLRRTGRLVIADVDWIYCGIGAEISAQISENYSKLLKKPVKRIGLPHVPHPTSYALEEVMYTDFNDIVKNVKALLK